MISHLFNNLYQQNCISKITYEYFLNVDNIHENVYFNSSASVTLIPNNRKIKVFSHENCKNKKQSKNSSLLILAKKFPSFCETFGSKLYHRNKRVHLLIDKKLYKC